LVRSTVHDDDVCSFDFRTGIGEIHHLADDAMSKPRLKEKFAGGIFVGWCQLDIDRSPGTGFEQIDLDRSNTAPPPREESCLRHPAS